MALKPPALPVPHPSGDLNKRWFILLKPQVIASKGFVFEIPYGFGWDGASVPYFSEHFGYRPIDVDWRATLVHDLLYRANRGTKTPGVVIDGSRKMTRKLADDIYLDIMKQDGVGWWGRTVRYISVRAKGGKYWDSK